MDDLFYPSRQNGGHQQQLHAAKRSFSIVFGYCACMMILLGMHIFLVPQSAEQPDSPLPARVTADDPFDATKCQAPPLSCWDGYNKRGGIYCVRAKQPLPLRGGESVLQPGSHSCYKALYFNVERATFVIAGWFLLWFTLASRGLERLASSWLAGKLNLLAAAATIINQFSLWYSASMIIHYTNDYWFDFYWSQMYYTLSEGYLYIVTAVLLHKEAQVPLVSVIMALGVAGYHISQLLLDEALNMMMSLHALRRGTFLLLTDASYIIALVAAPVFQRALQQMGVRRLALQVFAAATANAVVFYLVFADSASFNVS